MFNNQAIPADLDAKMDKRVKLKLFTTLQDSGYHQCPACENTASLVKNLHRATGKIEYEEISILDDPQTALRYHVQRAPTIIVQGHGIRYTGAPIGLETAPFVHTLVMASTGKTIFGNLLDNIAPKLRRARLELLVTPTCPYCSQAVLIENSLVMSSAGRLTIDVVETYENPDIARRYNVTGVPVTVIDGKDQITGVPTMQALLSRLS